MGQQIFEADRDSVVACVCCVPAGAAGDKAQLVVTGTSPGQSDDAQQKVATAQQSSQREAAAGVTREAELPGRRWLSGRRIIPGRRGMGRGGMVAGWAVAAWGIRAEG